MSTEARSARYAELDLWPTRDAVQAMAEGQLAAAATVAAQTSAIASAADAAAARLRDGGGRLIYIGAGTSGRIAVQDGVELGPTYGWDDERLVYALAGGMAALTRSAEGAEDDVAAAEEIIRQAVPGAADVAIGVAASGRTPFTVAALRAARATGALTIAIAGNGATPLLSAADHPILLDTGAEIVAGSTRMKAGTAQKIALNLLSTATMIRLGRVHGDLMVDMRISNRKLRARAVAMVSEIGGVDRAAAEIAIGRAEGDIKRAALIALGLDAEEAEAALAAAGGHLRAAIDALRG